VSPNVCVVVVVVWLLNVEVRDVLAKGLGIHVEGPADGDTVFADSSATRQAPTDELSCSALNLNGGVRSK
jgi:hypothetical protein